MVVVLDSAGPAYWPLCQPCWSTVASVRRGTAPSLPVAVEVWRLVVVLTIHVVVLGVVASPSTSDWCLVDS